MTPTSRLPQRAAVTRPPVRRVAAVLGVCLCLPLDAAPVAPSAPSANRAAPVAPSAAPAPAVPANAMPSAMPSAKLPRSMPLGCLIEASAVAEVGTAVIGVIESVMVERGDLVKRGQVLAQHDAKVERAAVVLAEARVRNDAELRSARSQIDFAVKKAERMATLTDLKFMSSQARDQADTEAALARMRLAQVEEQQALAEKELQMARAQLAQRTITSPLAGVVVERFVSPGERVENRPIFKIAQIDPLKVEVVLPASMYGQVKVGSLARVVPDLPGLPAREAAVSIVDRVIDAASNTFRARLMLRNADQALPSGVRCKIEFTPS